VGGQLLSTQPVAGPLGSPFVLLATDGLGASTGVTFGAFETSGGVVDQNWARVMRYRGYQTWVAVQNDTIYRTTDAGASWAAVSGPDADLGTTTTKSGLWLVYPGGIPSLATLVIVGYDGAGGYSLFSSADGVTWTKGAKYALTAQAMALQANAIWHSLLYCSAGLGAAARTYVADYNQDRITEFAQPDVHATQNDCSFCVFNDRFFGAWTKASDGAVGLFELVSSGWVLRATLAAAAPTFAADRKITLFVDQANMYAIFMIANPAFPGDPVPLLWVCIEIDSALTVTDRPIPVAGIHGGETNESRVATIVDGPAGGSGTLPEIDLYFSTDGVSGTGVATFRFNGSFAAITALSGGNNAQNAWPFGRQYSGNVFWTVGSRAVEKISSAPAPGGVRWSFQLFSPNPSVDSVSVRGFQGTAQDEYACGLLGANPNPVLANPSAGTLIGQTITGLDAADNGATTFTVDWLALTNGGFPFVVGNYGKTVLEVF